MKKIKLLTLLALPIAFLAFFANSPKAEATTEVTSSIYEGEIRWEASESPYHVSSTFLIYPDAKLTIEKGVTVLFDATTNGANSASMEVRGQLVIDGVQNEPVIFTRNGSDGKWGGIYVNTNLGGGLTASYTEFSYATSAINIACCNSGGPLKVADSFFYDNTTAISGYAGSTRMRIDRSIFENNKYATTAADKDFYDSTFKNNEYGLYSTERINVYNSTFTGHTQAALYGGRGDVKYSTITDNEVGVQAFFEGFDLSYNTIAKNNIGVITNDYDNSVPAINNNNIYNNSTYNIQNQTDVNVNAKNNYWGTTDEDAIRQTIYDGYNQAGLGIVKISDYLSTAVDITPPIEEDVEDNGSEEENDNNDDEEENNAEENSNGENEDDTEVGDNEDIEDEEDVSSLPEITFTKLTTAAIKGVVNGDVKVARDGHQYVHIKLYRNGRFWRARKVALNDEGEFSARFSRVMRTRITKRLNIAGSRIRVKAIVRSSDGTFITKFAFLTN